MNTTTLPRLTVVFAVPFNIYPVTNGGSLRGYSLLKELAKRFNVVAIVPAFAEEIRSSLLSELGDHQHSLTVKTLEIPGRVGPIGRLRDKALTMRLSRTISLSSHVMAIATCGALEDIARTVSVDVVILTTHELAICGSLVKRKMPGAVRIMDMHNVDHVLLKQELESSGTDPDRNSHYRRLKLNEGSLFRHSDGVFACSQYDLDHLKSINKFEEWKGAVIRNGVDIETAPYDPSQSKSSSKSLLFCGTLAYLPNIDGLNWFHSNAWPLVRAQHPDARLIVIGRGLDPKNFPNLLDDGSVNLIGEVESLQPYYRQTGVAICPLRMGSGTRFKIVEAMAFGNPVVSTAIGCQGLGAKDEQHLLIRDRAEDFAAGICELLNHPLAFDRLRGAARDFVQEEYAWEDIGAKMCHTISQWASHASAPARRRIRKESSLN